MADEQLRIATARRFGAVCYEAGRRCHNRKESGERCGDLLDQQGHHGSVCECGGALGRRHDGLRDLLKRRLAEHLGASTHLEQHAPSMAIQNDTARLDVAVTLPGTPTQYLDVAIVDAYSVSIGIEMQRAKRPGMAAQSMEHKKRAKYGAGQRMVPFIIEAHGRLGGGSQQMAGLCLPWPAGAQA